jgi:hypothetical protein
MAGLRAPLPPHGSGPRWLRHAFLVEDLHPYSRSPGATQIKSKLIHFITLALYLFISFSLIVL